LPGRAFSGDAGWALVGSLFMIAKLLIAGCLVWAVIGLCKLTTIGIGEFLVCSLVAWLIWAGSQTGKGDKGE
jgi:hypothetical protein